MKNFILLFFCFSAIFAQAQSKKFWIYKADEFFVAENYENALSNYLKAASDTSGLAEEVLPYEIQLTNQKLSKKGLTDATGKSVALNDYLNHQIAVCYLKTADYTKAEEYFGISSATGSYNDDSYFYAATLMNNKKYDQAITAYESYIKSGKYNDSLLRAAQVSVKACYFATNPENIQPETQLIFADSVFNQGTSAFAPMFFGNEQRLMFTSARNGGVILKPEQESAYLCDIYWTEKDSLNHWKPAVNFGRPLNSAQHDAAATISPGNIIYYTRWSDENRKNQEIYLARMVDFKFYEAFKLGQDVNVPGYKSMHPFVSIDGKTLYFSSNRPGGSGGFDIWQIQLDSLGNTVGEAKNLGYPVNSEQDEVTPFFHTISSTLFFSSNGHQSIGGLDVFKAIFNLDNNSFEIPENLGMPINSSYDDAYLIWDSRLKKGYFASDREPCSGGHCFDIYEISNSPIHIALSGYSYDLATNELLPNTTLTIKDVKGEFSPITITTDSAGYYHQELTTNMEIFLKASKEKYFADAATVNTKTITESTELTQDFYLNPIPQEAIEIEGIEYDFNSAKLRPVSMQILDKLYEFLVLNDNLVVEIQSHTDSRGSDKYNMNLSQKRAKSCVDYLISKGIDPNRLIPKGFGESEPNVLLKDKKPVLDENGNKIVLTETYIENQPTKAEKEELHQRNRRTSFKVINEKFEVVAE